jgi:hypothetical protein
MPIAHDGRRASPPFPPQIGSHPPPSAEFAGVVRMIPDWQLVD